MNTFVLDCSTMVACFLPDEAFQSAKRILLAIEGGRALVPALWPYEVASAFLAAQRRQRISPTQRAEYLQVISEMPVEIQQAPKMKDSSVIAGLASDWSLSVYDASYVDLAIRHNVPLATLDQKLAAAASLAGIKLF